MRIKLVDTTRFKLTDEKIINYYRDYDKNCERIEFSITVRDNKQHNFFVYFDIIWTTRI